MKTRYKSHLFICTKSRGGEQKACMDKLDPDMKSVLKDAIKDRGWKGVVRVSESSCLGICEIGPNIMIYPQEILLANVSMKDVPEILSMLEEFVDA